MTIARRVLLGAALAGTALARPALAQRAWPNRPIRLVLGFAPGGVGDLTARMIAPKISEGLGQPIIIDNRPGAAGIVAAEPVARATPDGYTMLLLTTTNSTADATYRSLPYDTKRDFAPVARVATFDHVLLTAANSPYRTLKDVIEAARAKPGSINLGSIAVGNAQHLGAELLRSMAGADMTVVPYRSTPDLINATTTGDVHIASEILAPVLGQIQGGRLRALAMASAERYPLLPDVPTATERDLPGYVVGSWNGVAGPAGMPRAVVERMNSEIGRVLALPEIREKLLELGVTPAFTSPEDFGTFIRTEGERWSRIVEEANIPKQ
ncbi:Bug family tripartite tricarboxylate transporter substrate binding protein [Muricoccus aerilatus]|uniref:Bug family tripartite tricarboxylate transporter substrate binding protein n=1 Tax=Muricoccus aerilatus TaxID=452982 RepID=UPI0005C25640|nr:tripartite tricarboxylate transporter substrate binding protein [Roseomonas aerilata]